MKFCTRCGVQNSDGAAFCSSCGSRFTDAGPQTPPVYIPTQTYQNQNPGPPSDYSQPCLKLLKKHGASTLFLATICVYAAMLLSQIINILNPHSYAIKYFEAVMQSLESSSTSAVSDILTNMSGALYISQVIFGLIFLSIPVLIGIGMFLTYLSSKDNSHTGIKTTGLSIIRVIMIIELVFVCVAVGLGLLISLIAIGSAPYSNGTDTAVTAFGIAFVLLFMIIIFGGIAAFCIIYYLKILSAIKSVAYTAQTGKPGKKISMFIPVVNIIQAAGTLFSLAMYMTFIPFYNNLASQVQQQQFNINGEFYYSYNSAPVVQIPGLDAVTVINMLLFAAFLTMISVVILKYRSEAEKLNCQNYQSYQNYHSYGDYNNYNTYKPDMQNTQNSQPFSYTVSQPRQQIAQPPASPPAETVQPQNTSPFVPPDDDKKDNTTDNENKEE